MEQILDWLNENEIRAYPLLDSSNNKTFNLFNNTSWDFPDNFLIDLQLVVLKESFDLPVFLKKISFSPTSGVTVVFGTFLKTIADFNISISTLTNMSSNLYIRKPTGSLAVFGFGIKNFAEACLDNAVEIYPELPVEPTVCYELNAPWLGVNSIQVTPEKLSQYDSDEVFRPLLDVSTPSKVYGDIKLLPGYNFDVKINSGLIDLAVSSVSGKRPSCTTSFLLEKYLDCDEIISYINGVPPGEDGNLTISAGANINIINGNTLTSFNDAFSEEAQNSTLFVGLNFKPEDVCAPVAITPSLL
jgi:hypothetical protein